MRRGFDNRYDGTSGPHHLQRKAATRARLASLAALLTSITSLAPLALASIIFGAAGCGDGVACPNQVIVVIGGLIDGSEVSVDQDAARPGVQLDIPVRSSLREGEELLLVVTDSLGAVSSFTAFADAAGDAVFADVTLPGGPVTLRVTGVSADCGEGADEVAVTVVGQASCALAIREGPLANDFYDPIPVLNTSNDSDPVAPGFQANIDVQSASGFAIDLLVLDFATGVETSLATGSADAAGAISFAVDLGQGRQALRATCLSPTGAASAASATNTVFVDTVAPACSVTNPADGAAIIPPQDLDPVTPGTQIALVGNAATATDDVLGEPAAFAVNGVVLSGTDIDELGDSTALATFEVVDSYEISFSTRDHAGNACTAVGQHEYVEEGCAIAFVTDVGEVFTADANSDPADGLQVDLLVQVDPADCEGALVTTDCGETDVQAAVPTGGLTSLPLTMCADAACETSDTCTVTVTSPAGLPTTIGATLVADTLPPNALLQFVNPPTACGEVIADEDDVDGDPANGVQIDVRVVSPFADESGVEVTNGAGTATTPAGTGGDTRITVELGDNDVRGFAEDIFDNRRDTGPCNVLVADIAIEFAPEIADGTAGRADGTAGAGALTLDVCGTVSELGASVDVSIDGGAAQAANVVGNDWCLPDVTLAESPPVHTIDVTATAGASVGAASLDLAVDVTTPDTPASFAAISPTRQSIVVTWDAPADGGAPTAAYRIKLATTALTDANFDVTGVALPAPTPAAPGAPESLAIPQLLAGMSYFVGVAAVDAAGNRSTAQIAGPITPQFDRSGEVLAVDPGTADNQNGLGYQVARGDFNGDGFGDLAVSAPFRQIGGLLAVGAVYVYFGAADGFGPQPVTPDVTIEGQAQNAQFGNGLTAIQWSGDAADDLAVGAPFGDNSNGQVFIFEGGAAFASLTSTADASVVIGSAGGWFEFSGIGYTLATARFDGDANDDLIICAPAGGAGNGGVVVIHGGTAETSISMSDIDPAGSGTAVIRVIEDPQTTTFDLFGQWIVNLGRTEGVGDTDDDLGVAYFEDPSVWVLRGRPQPASPGVTISSVDAGDLEIIDDSTDPDGAVHFGSAMSSIADQNGDGARDIAIGGWREGNNAGRVVIVDGDEVGAHNLAAIELARITPQAGGAKLGTAVLNNAAAQIAPDIDDDGLEDLVVLGSQGGLLRLFVWFGASGLPVGSVTTASAHHVIDAPPSFTAQTPPFGGTPNIASWAGDVNDDGLEDICFTDYIANSRDGGFELLWDDGL